MTSSNRTPRNIGYARTGSVSGSAKVEFPAPSVLDSLSFTKALVIGFGIVTGIFFLLF